jgi:hypothetical protein
MERDNKLAGDSNGVDQVVDLQAPQADGWSKLFGRAKVRGTVTKETGRGDRLREHNAYRNENGAGAGSVGDCNFDSRTFRIMIPAAETNPAFG